MDRLDQFIVRELGCRAYARYVDYMVLLADDKRTLRDWAEAVNAFAANRLRLRLHRHSAHAQPTAGGVPWLGMVIYPTHRLLKSRKVVAATRRLRAAWRDWQLGQAPFDALAAYRNHNQPDNDNNNIGLRWQMSRHIPGVCMFPRASPI